jgi:ATP-dependent DNA ligase
VLSVVVGEDEPVEIARAGYAEAASTDRKVFDEHYIGDGAIIYRHACALGYEGIVWKRLGSHYRAGRADCWVKVKNPAAPAVTREAEEEWN